MNTPFFTVFTTYYDLENNCRIDPTYFTMTAEGDLSPRRSGASVMTTRHFQTEEDAIDYIHRYVTLLPNETVLVVSTEEFLELIKHYYGDRP